MSEEEIKEPTEEIEEEVFERGGMATIFGAPISWIALFGAICAVTTVIPFYFYVTGGGYVSVASGLFMPLAGQVLCLHRKLAPLVPYHQNISRSAPASHPAANLALIHHTKSRVHGSLKFAIANHGVTDAPSRKCDICQSCLHRVICTAGVPHQNNAQIRLVALKAGWHQRLRPVSSQAHLLDNPDTFKARPQFSLQMPTN